MTALATQRLSRIASRKLIALVATLVVTFGLLPAVGQAHSTTGVPDHTRPELDPSRLTYNSHCLLNFSNPTVLGYTSEYVYWAPVVGYYTNGQWRYAYGDWHRAYVSSARMVYGWEARNAFTNAWEFSNGLSGIYVPRGTDAWLGFHIYYSSRAWESQNAHHFEWLGGPIRC
jgi:hypothetical protein